MDLPNHFLGGNEVDGFCYSLSKFELHPNLVQRRTNLSRDSTKEDLFFQGNPRLLDLNRNPEYLLPQLRTAGPDIE
jgi:hypothetical protein